MKDNLISMSWFDYKKRMTSLLEIFFTDIYEMDSEIGHETIYSLWSDYACVRITRYEMSGYDDKYLLQILDLSKFEQKVEMLGQYICGNTVRELSGDIYRLESDINARCHIKSEVEKYLYLDEIYRRA